MQNPLKRQLEGFLNTSPLWIKSQFMDLKQFMLPDPFLKDDPSIIAQIPALTSNFVLGKRMENFLELQLQKSASHHLIACNIQIHRDKITLGELDFLLKDLIREQVIHLEMVYKFYVYDPSFENETERWIGPNRKDSLLKKIDRIISHQFPLLYEPETAIYLSQLGLDQGAIEQQICFKANLFYPKFYKEDKTEVFNPACIAGYWLHLKEFTSGEYSSFTFYAPNKLNWPVHPEYNTEWESYSEILRKIEKLFKNERSPLIWMKKNEFLFERFFVVWW